MKKLYLLTYLIAFSLSYFAQSLNFDGNNDYVIAINAGPSSTQDRTVECWIKTSTSIGTQMVIVDWGAMSPLGSRFTLNMINQGRIRIEIGGNGFNSNRQIADGLWHHIAVTYDHSAAVKASLYIDGMLDTARNFTRSVNTLTTNPIQIGRRNDGVNYFIGEIDEVRIWDVARSSSEISSNMNTEYCTIPSNLVAYYKFNEGIPNSNNAGRSIASNYVTNLNNGTLTNFSLNGSSSNWSNQDTSLVKDLNLSIHQIGASLVSADSTADRYEWYDCGRMNVLSTDTLQSFLPTTNSSYAVIVYKGFCIDTSACFNYISVGLAEQGLSKVQVYPNPSNGQITISNIESLAKIEVYNLQGQLQQRMELSKLGFAETRNKNSHRISASTFPVEIQGPKGIYFLKLISNEGEQKSIKIIKR